MAIGRFAPTPSGPLHMGSLLTALGSWLQMRQLGGQWRIRMDDLDAPRCVSGADSLILRQLEAYGLCWDGPVDLQSQHLEDYRAALARLETQHKLYACTCTRATLAATALAGPDGPVYAGTCRMHVIDRSKPHALRFRVEAGIHQWQDGVQGLVSRQLPIQSGDFVVQRADGQIGYHLACAVDEARMSITQVMRGVDLLGATVSQQLLMLALGLPIPAYAHLPVLIAADGRKFSKQNGAAAIALDAHSITANLGIALRLLGYATPEFAAQPVTPADWLNWALAQTAPTPPCAFSVHLEPPALPC